MKTCKNITLVKKIIIIIIIISIFSLIYSGFKIFKWYYESNQTKEITKKIYENTTINEDYIFEKSESNAIINDSVLTIDFNNLKQINTDLKGWIQLKGTNINYPYVQTNNNKFYLKNNFYKKKTNAGWIFQDYRNNNLDNKNTIIYGHGRLDNTMFGSLKNTMNANWLNNETNHIVKITTENKKTLWQVFSIYKIKNTDDYIKTDFSNDEEFSNFINLIKNRSIYNFKTNIDQNNKILTLSTCYKENNRLVLHAVLIKEI